MIFVGMQKFEANEGKNVAGIAIDVWAPKWLISANENDILIASPKNRDMGADAATTVRIKVNRSSRVSPVELSIIGMF